MNSTTPFSPTQQKLILWAAALFVLVACGNLVKNYHPRFRRGRLFRYTPLGLVVLAAVLTVECVIAVYAIDLIPRHPLWFPSAAVFGLIFLLICAKIDEYREKAIAPVPATTTQSKRWELNQRTTLRLAAWYAGVLVCSLVMVPFSLYGQLFGPQRGIVFAIIALLLSMAVFFLAHQPVGIRFLEQYPTGLSGPHPELHRWRRRIERMLVPIGLLAFLSVAAMFASSRGAGGPSDNLPALASREHYVLTNHGRRTEVSALRFCVASSSGLIAWHAGALLVSLLALYGLFYGELPPQFRRDLKKTSSGKHT